MVTHKYFWNILKKKKKKKIYFDFSVSAGLNLEIFQP